ncbi:MAG: MBL fold metallo-hydrolase [Candidatus Nitrohelix vancouverensis]|uniref:MBL fold metallo-hydrolase n=1 Tax=Candidatus Nitrohelix vancouverensis TaxID=2705534 RepID=A0A7T0G4D9_9BACT|nr:MAG: MBL fold metallo-hydrolase [Candidatus Nitrohelix vancouverensis]
MALEDELGDILQKARDGKNWSQDDLAQATGISRDDLQRIESYQLTPEDSQVLKLADALDLDGPALIDSAQERWIPQAPLDDPDFDLVCLNVFMGEYPVNCFLLRCKATGETAVVDTGANPKTIINKAREMNVKPSMILLTHAHPDHAGGLGELTKAFECPTYIDHKEPKPKGSSDFKIVKDGDEIRLGNLRIQCIETPGHTTGGVSYLINQTLLSGDVIFAGSMGRANSSWQDLFNSITQKVLRLPDATGLHPGHGPATTVAQEKEHNPFFKGRAA